MQPKTGDLSVMAERALRESEGRFRAFVNATTDVVYRMNADWSEMRELDGRGILADTTAPTRSWREWRGKWVTIRDPEQLSALVGRQPVRVRES